MDDYLKHYGVEGMRWGVRKYQNSDGSLTAQGRIRYGLDRGREILGRQVQSVGNIAKYGIRQGHAKNVSSRINRYVMNETRKGHMTDRQLESAKKAQKYWKKRAEGIRNRAMSPEERRGLIKRYVDDYRSYSEGERLVQNIISNFNVNKAQVVQGNIGIGEAAASTALGSIGSMTIDELSMRLFGHF